jgi:hypothetical protein
MVGLRLEEEKDEPAFICMTCGTALETQLNLKLK